MIHERELAWLPNDLVHVPEDRLLVISAHIPFVTYIDATAQKHQMDSVDELYATSATARGSACPGHTHTTEQIEPGEHYRRLAGAHRYGPA